MKDIETLEFDPRVFRRKTGAPDPDGECVVYWMQRSQRATDSPALNVAVDAANLLRKPVVVFFQLLPRAHHANLRHYEFMLQGLEEIGSALRKRHGTSQLSPYLHFGQIGAHAVAIAVKKSRCARRGSQGVSRRVHRPPGAGDQFRALQSSV